MFILIRVIIMVDVTIRTINIPATRVITIVVIPSVGVGIIVIIVVFYVGGRVFYIDGLLVLAIRNIDLIIYLFIAIIFGL